MKSALFFLLAVAFTLSSLVADPLYQRKIVTHGDLSPMDKEAAAALASWLSEMSEAPFEVTDTAPDDDVIFLISNADYHPGDRVEGTPDAENPEAYLIAPGKDGKGLYLIGSSDLGLRHAVYRYLHELGYRSLFPGPNWQIAPKRSDIRLSASIRETPAFLQRTFFGTGGFHSKLPLDPDGQIARMWGTWQAANRFGSSIHLGGHYGEAFIQKHLKTFEENPDFRAMVNGERVPMSSQFQLNYGNPQLRKLYVEDRLADLRARVERLPNSPQSRAISVDPADGSGHCQSPESTALGSVSDRVFGLANETAKAVQKEFPGRYVNLYAYNDHSDVTAFKLEENVIVSVIPYGFNRARTLLGDDLLLAWKEKASQIGIYDYWALPDWSRGMPQLDYLHRVPEKLRFWYANRVRFFNGESSTGAGTTGIGLYIASRLLWDPSADDRAILDEFYQLAFGPARPPMQRMLERWANGFALNDNELALSFRDLAQARQLAASDPACLARVDDYVTYVHYLRLLREFLAIPAADDARAEATDGLHRYLWQVRDNAMLQTFRLSQLLRNTWSGKDEVQKATWDYTDANAPGWATVPPAPTPEQVAALLADGVNQYPVLFEPVEFSDDLVALTPPDAPSDEARESFRFFKGTRFQFQADRDGELEFALFLTEVKAPPRAVIQVTEQGAPVAAFDFPTDGEWHPFRVPVQKGKVYLMRIDGRHAHTQLRYPTSLPLVLHGGFVPISWVHTKGYFFVPKGTKRFAISIQNNPIPEKMIVCDSDEAPLSPNEGSRPDFPVFDVPNGTDGGIWSMDKVTSSLPIRLMNVPDNFSFTPEALMVPREVAPKP